MVFGKQIRASLGFHRPRDPGQTPKPEGGGSSLRLRPPESASSSRDGHVGISEKEFRSRLHRVGVPALQLTLALISHMATFSEELEPLKQAISRQVKADMGGVEYWKSLVHSFVCERLFADFGTEYFMDEAATISAKGSYFLDTFCYHKFKLITGDLATTFPIYQEDWSTEENERHPKSDVYKHFKDTAISLWRLHNLVRSSRLELKMIGWKTYPQGSKFQDEFMSPVKHELLGSEESMDMVVGTVVFPGFQISGFLIKCKFYPTFIPSHDQERVDDIRLHLPVVSNQDASSSHDIRERNDPREADNVVTIFDVHQDGHVGISENKLRDYLCSVSVCAFQLTLSLISQMDTFSEELEPLKQAIRRDVKAEVGGVGYWKSLVHSFVCKRLFADFETEYFTDGAAPISAKMSEEYLYLERPSLESFCYHKFKLITGDLATTFPIYQEDWSTEENERHPKSDVYRHLKSAAVSLWWLHDTLGPFRLELKMIGWKTYPQGSKFQEEFMSPVKHELLGEESMDMVVGTVVFPGFQMSDFIIKCKFYPTFIPSHHRGRADDIRLHLPVVSNQDASSSHGDGNAMESSSPELTSSSTWSSSGAFTKPSEPIQTNNGSSISSAGGRPHEEHELSPPRDSSRSSPSGTMQDGPSVYKPSTDSIIEDNVKKYTWDQVLRMTNGATSKRLGKGGFGTVSLGKLENGKEVAVKILDRSSQQGAAEFLNEVNLLNRVHHKNLVRLLGYCRDEEQVLIYEFAEEGSIWDHLHGDRQWLDWRQRLNIALESACGIEYLHNSCSPRILHRDIKSENILLTKTWTAKVADFGLSRLGADQDNNYKTHITTKVMGTRGYLDPEYHLTGQLRDSSDVYSFGVVLLEIITGRKPVPNSDPRSCITNWVEKTYGNGGSRALKAVADPLFIDKYDPRALKLVIKVARACTTSSGESRPNIAEVVHVLRKAQALEHEEKKPWFPFL